MEIALALSLPQREYTQIAIGSGHATKNLIDIGAGVVDLDYNTKMVVSDHSTEAFSSQGQ